MNPISKVVSKVNLWGLGRGSLLTSQELLSRKKVTFGSSELPQNFQQNPGSALLVGLGRAELIRIYQENRKKSSN